MPAHSGACPLLSTQPAGAAQAGPQHTDYKTRRGKEMGDRSSVCGLPEHGAQNPLGNPPRIEKRLRQATVGPATESQARISGPQPSQRSLQMCKASGSSPTPTWSLLWLAHTSTAGEGRGFEVRGQRGARGLLREVAGTQRMQCLGPCRCWSPR